MQVTNTTATDPTTLPTDNPSGRVAQKELGQKDFLKLLTVQLANQDPMKPMEDTSFIAQMAQFSSLTQMNSLVDEMGFLRADTQMQAASSLLGREVTVTTKNGDVAGKVESVKADSSNVFVRINGETYPFASITEVKPLPVSEPAA